MRLSNRILLAAIMTWAFSVTLGLLFAAMEGHFSIGNLLLPGVVPVALIISTVISIILTPLAAWSLRTGAKNLYVYAPALWFLLAAYIILIIPRGGRHAAYGLVAMAVIGVTVLGFIPSPK